METKNEVMMGESASTNIYIAWLKEEALVSSYKEIKILFDYDLSKFID